MKAIVLAAGRGARLGSITESTPKCMLTVGPRRIIDYQMQCLEALYIRDIVVVVGFMAASLRQYLSEAFPKLGFTFVENPQFATTNTAYSLWLARDEFTNDDFIYCNGDVLFHAEILRRLVYSPEKNILAITRTATGDEEVKVLLNGSRIVAIGKDVPAEQACGEFIGIGKFSKAIAPLFAAQLWNVVKNPSGEMQFFEAALQRMVSSVKLSALDVTDLPSIEIDFPEDLQVAERRIIKKIARTKKDSPKHKILFYAERNLHLPFLEPIHDYLAERYDVDLAFSAPPYKISQGGNTGCGLCRDDILRLQSKSCFVDNPATFQADIGVVADACFYPVRHCKKIVNVGHGLICKGWFYTDNPVVRRENRADLICVPGTWHKEILERNVLSTIRVTGFIKTDALVNCTDYDIKKFKEKYHIPEGKKIVLFAPTFNPELSALPCVGERIEEILDDNLMLLVKLHGMTDKTWVSQYQHLAAQAKNIALIEDTDGAAALVCSDVLISDVSSVAAEYMLLDKPVVFYNNPRQKEYCQYRPSDIEYVIRDAGIQVGTVEELKLAVQVSLAQPQRYSDKRRAYAARLSLPLDGRCAERAGEAIMDILQSSPACTNKFSILVQWDGTTPAAECVQRILEHNEGAAPEIVFLGPRGTGCADLKGVSTWVECAEMNRKAFLRAFRQTHGDYIVVMRSDMVLPKNWLRWMRNYFAWYPDSGAVRALSPQDDYQPILKSVPQPPKTMPDIAEYFLCALMGNSVRCTVFDLRKDCVMLSRSALEKVISETTFYSDSAPLETFGTELTRHGFSLWQAVEVFWYPLRGEDHQTQKIRQETVYRKDDSAEIARAVQQASEFKKQKDYAQAILCLERAKQLLNALTNQSSYQDFDAENNHTVENEAAPLNCVSSFEKARLLYHEARKLKKAKNYTQAIELLETAKMCIA